MRGFVWMLDRWGLTVRGSPAWVGGVLATAALASASVWGLSGLSREELREVAGALRTVVTGWLDALTDACGEMTSRLRARFGLARELRADVGLGDVSEMVDIVRLGLQAGLSFDASLGLYCEGRSGALSRQMARARLSWQTGLATRQDALVGAARELGLRPLESFAIAVTQAIELGAPLADTLERQGREIRSAHRADVERQIERAPVKLLIPTGTLILPALLVSIVGPLVAAGGMA